MPEVRATHHSRQPADVLGKWWIDEQRFEVLLSSIILSVPLRLYLENHDDTYFVLRVGDPKAACNVTGRPNPWKGRKWLLSPHMTDGEVVQTAFLALMVAMEHELREQFTFRGQPIFDPHYDIDKLVVLRSKENSIEGRDEVGLAVADLEEKLAEFHAGVGDQPIVFGGGATISNAGLRAGTPSCLACSGTGRAAGTSWPCEECSGTGNARITAGGKSGV